MALAPVARNGTSVHKRHGGSLKHRHRHHHRRQYWNGQRVLLSAQPTEGGSRILFITGNLVAPLAKKVKSGFAAHWRHIHHEIPVPHDLTSAPLNIYRYRDSLYSVDLITAALSLDFFT